MQALIGFPGAGLEVDDGDAEALVDGELSEERTGGRKL